MVTAGGLSGRLRAVTEVYISLPGCNLVIDSLYLFIFLCVWCYSLLPHTSVSLIVFLSPTLALLKRLDGSKWGSACMCVPLSLQVN